MCSLVNKGEFSERENNRVPHRYYFGRLGHCKNFHTDYRGVDLYSFSNMLLDCYVGSGSKNRRAAKSQEHVSKADRKKELESACDICMHNPSSYFITEFIITEIGLYFDSLDSVCTA